MTNLNLVTQSNRDARTLRRIGFDIFQWAFLKNYFSTFNRIPIYNLEKRSVNIIS